MIEHVNIPCSLCKDHFRIPEDAPEKCTIVQRGEWKIECDFHGLLLDKAPVNGAHHFVVLSAPLNFYLNDILFIWYQGALTYLNGIESEQDLNSVRVCECRVYKIHEVTHLGALIEVDILQSSSYADIATWPKQTNFSLNDFFHGVLTNDVSRNNICYYENFAQISADVQGDLGISLTLYKKDHSLSILSINDWGFHRNFTYVGNFAIEEEKLKPYGWRYHKK